MASPHDMMLPPSDPHALVEATWDELGSRIRPLPPRVYVRTWEIPEKIGHIIIPPRFRSFYRGLPHSKFVRATVIAAPPGCPLQPGDFCGFPQTFFARYKNMVDGTLLGYLDWRFVHGRLVLTPEDAAWIQSVREGIPCAA